jgi:hypothetical protein
MDEPKRILIFPEYRDDAEILLLCQVNARVEVAGEFWNRRRQV